MSQATKRCQHCGEPVPKSRKDHFCCSGCSAAYCLIAGLNLKSYYQNRQIDPDLRPLIPEEQTFENLALYQKCSEGHCTLHLMVDGLHCAACVWLIETVLSQQKGVIDARVNMTTKRLKLVWEEDKNTAQKLIRSTNQLGYRLIPYDPTLLESLNKKKEKHLLLCMAIAGFSAANVMLFSIALWAGAMTDDVTRSLFQWLSAFIVLPASAYAGKPFFQSAWGALRHRQLNMDVPISLAILTTLAMSLYDTITGLGHTYFESAAMLLFFLLVGRYMDMRARGKSRNAAEQLLLLQATMATIISNNGTSRTIPANQVRHGDMMLVASGERLAADGIVQGEALLDTSPLTGESVPTSFKRGEIVHAGCLNVGRALRIKITATCEHTRLSMIVQLVEEAAQAKNAYTTLADKAARAYAPSVHALSGITLTGWLIAGASGHQALTYAVAVLIITCPCALALAVPTVQVVAVSKLLRLGILLKTATALEQLKDITLVVFDKTGTLTMGQFRFLEGGNKDQQKLAARLAKNSTHPLANALAGKYPDEKPIKNVEEKVGQGLVVYHNKKEIRLGNRQFCKAITKQKDELPELWLSIKGQEPVRFTFEDTLRKNAAKTIKLFEKNHIKTTLLSGDRDEVVKDVSKKAGIQKWQAQASPEDKYNSLKKWKKQGEKPLMFGDGINDAPALATAHVGLTLGSGTDIAKTSADIIIQNPDLQACFTTWKIAQNAHRLVKFNMAFSLGYNVVTVPLAMAGFITPLWAAIFMSASSVTVVLNALRLKST